jgi:hypothetical protein
LQRKKPKGFGGSHERSDVPRFRGNDKVRL